MISINKIKIEKFENEIYQKYIKLFPEEEQREWNNIRKSYEKGLEEFYEIANENVIVGFILLERLNDKTPYYMDYFAIYAEHQNKGYGTEAIKILLRDIVKDKGLCIEIEKENDGCNDEEILLRQRRGKFYRNLGFKKVESEYLLYNVLYTPYIYDVSDKFSKEDIDRIMFDYYVENCGKEAINKKCKIIF